MEFVPQGIIFDYAGTLGHGGTVVSGALALLEHLRSADIRLALVTRSGRARIAETGLLPLFDPCIVDASKSVDVFRSVIDAWALPMDRVLIVGDSWDIEIAAARVLHAPWIHIDPRCTTITRADGGWRVPNFAALETLLRALVRATPGTNGATPSPRPG